MKTQTRRVVKWPAWVTDDHRLQLAAQRPATGLAYYVDGRPRRVMACPFGGPGDFLWVRETWAPTTRAGFVYRADDDPWEPMCWRPSIHMPRLASRISLRVEDVRVERLLAITEEDAKAEGAAHRIAAGGDLAGAFDTCDTPIIYRAHFRDLWERINGAESWDANPWVWVVTFARVDSIPEGAKARPILFSAPMVRAILSP